LARELGMEPADDRGEQVKIEMLGELWGSALKGLARWWYDRSDVPRTELVEKWPWMPSGSAWSDYGRASDRGAE
jgi:hypothetical protein